MASPLNRTHTCMYCWQQVTNYDQHIGVECPQLPMNCVFGCGKCITCSEMLQHCQQCENTTRVISQQQQQQFPVNCTAVEESTPPTDGGSAGPII